MHCYNFSFVLLQLACIQLAGESSKKKKNQEKLSISSCEEWCADSLVWSMSFMCHTVMSGRLPRLKGICAKYQENIKT